jgi:hypothetical protein
LAPTNNIKEGILNGTTCTLGDFIVTMVKSNVSHSKKHLKNPKA